jgi:hypothetical protein
MTTRSKPSITLTMSTVQFLCEQNGPIETALKERLSELFRSGGLIRRAYFVRVTYEERGATTSVALALRTSSGRDEPSLVGPIGAAFASIFGSHEHLDILFVTESQEAKLKAVCKAFYTTPLNTRSLN